MYVQDVENFTRKDRLLEEWYDERRKIIFESALNQMYRQIKFYGIKCPTIDIRQMKLRCRSYLPQQYKILLNKDLIIAPHICIDYVVLHELL